MPCSADEEGDENMLQKIMQKTPLWAKSLAGSLALASCGNDGEKCFVGADNALDDVAQTIQANGNIMTFYDVKVGNEMFDIMDVYLSDGGINVEAMNSTDRVWLYDGNRNDNPELIQFENSKGKSPVMNTQDCVCDQDKYIFFKGRDLVRKSN